MKKFLLVIAAVVSSASGVAAQGMAEGSGALKWGAAPPNLPKGAQLAVLSGDPGSAGPFVVRLKLPAGYKIPAHSHPTAEFVTVLAGSFHLGMGDKLDPKQGKALGPGGFAEAAANMNHFGWTTAPTIIQINGQGPFAINYVNPADDPSKQ